MCVHYYLNIQGYPSISKNEMLVLCVYYSSDLYSLHAGCYLCVWVYAQDVHCTGVLVWWGTSYDCQ